MNAIYEEKFASVHQRTDHFRCCVKQTIFDWQTSNNGIEEEWKSFPSDLINYDHQHIERDLSKWVSYSNRSIIEFIQISLRYSMLSTSTHVHTIGNRIVEWISGRNSSMLTYDFDDWSVRLPRADVHDLVDHRVYEVDSFAREYLVESKCMYIDFHVKQVTEWSSARNDALSSRLFCWCSSTDTSLASRRIVQSIDFHEW